jgi:hypothetical protein
VRSHDADRVEALSRELAGQLRDDPTPSPEAFIRELERAVTRFDRPRVVHLCEVLVRRLLAHAVDYREAKARKRVLDLLRRKRHFGLMADVAEAMVRLDGGGTTVRRQLVQALLDQGQTTAGLALLAHLETDCQAVGDRKELLEARGLVGRAHKQIYVDGALAGAAPADDAESLRRAIKAYEGVYREGAENTWHGINTVALLLRARRDGVDVAGVRTKPEAAAAKILKRMERQRKNAEVWDCATAVEACVALGRFEEAARWATDYVDHADADAFEYASTLRQLEEVWELSPEDPEHAPILQVIREALLRRKGGRVEIADPVAELRYATELAEDPRFEMVLGLDRYRPFRWYRTGLARASRVAKICDRFGRGHGTGFVVPGDALHPSLVGRWVLVTNAHVLSDDPTEQGGMPAALSRGAARVSFEAGPVPTAELGVERILFTSPRNRLDFTLATLSSDPPVSENLPFAQGLPRLDSNQRVYVIGHPRGGGLSFSLDDNLLLDHESPRVHYRAPTEGGSSGSPVFNASWELIALHHAGSETMARLNGQPGTYPANEGIAIQSIRQAVEEQIGRGG